MPKKYYVHILNWPFDADSPEAAAQTALASLDSEGGRFLYYNVSEYELGIDGNDVEEFDSESWFKEGNQDGRNGIG